jgi:hypothetical protein
MRILSAISALSIQPEDRLSARKTRRLFQAEDLPSSRKPRSNSTRQSIVVSETSIKLRRQYEDGARLAEVGPTASWRPPSALFSTRDRSVHRFLSFRKLLAITPPPWVSSSLMRGGRRVGAGRPRGSGSGKTTEIKSVSMTPSVWQKLDQLRGTSSRGVWIAAKVNQAFNMQSYSTTTNFGDTSSGSSQQQGLSC